VLGVVGDLDDLQDPPGREVQQRRAGRLRGTTHPVDQQVDHCRRLVAQLGRRRRGHHPPRPAGDHHDQVGVAEVGHDQRRRERHCDRPEHKGHGSARRLVE
jgi:hypothetical protein